MHLHLFLFTYVRIYIDNDEISTILPHLIQHCRKEKVEWNGKEKEKEDKEMKGRKRGTH
jgi:hypothetical protein